MAAFEEALHSHIAQAMSGAQDANMNTDIIRQAPFVTLASSFADARIDAKWPSANIDAEDADDVDLLQVDSVYDSVFCAFDTDADASAAQSERISEVPSARSLFADEENEDIRSPRNLSEDADTHQCAADDACLARPLRGAGDNYSSDDDAEVHNTNENADDDSDEGGRYVFSSSDDSEIYLAPHADEDISGAERARTDVDTDDDIDEEPFDRRGFERERGAGEAAAVKKKHRRKGASDDAPARKGDSAKAKRKRDTTDADEQARLRKIQAQRKIDLKTKMASEEQKKTVQQYLLTCAIEYTRLVRHAENPVEPYKKYRTLVLEAAQDENCEIEVRDMANAVLETDAENMETVSCATNANPEPMRAMCDFVANAVLVTKLAECPATAARCDITQRPAEHADLVCMQATGADGRNKTVVLRSALRNLLLHVWTLTNLYDLTVCMVQEWVKKAARKEPQWSVRDTITRAPADDILQARLLKKIAEAHAMVNWSSAAFAKK